MNADDVARRVAEIQFTPVRMREGYDMGEVDELLDRIVAVATDPVAVRALARGARFTPVRLREGYAMAEVDRFLASLSTGEAAAADPPRVPEGPASDGGIRETRGWWSRLFGSKDS